MISFIIDQYKQSKALRYVVIAFVLLSLWWISIYARSLTEGLENDIFTCIYGLLALVGGSYGWFFARKWGGFRSVLGRSMGFFSIGLFAQFLGQVFYNSYIYILGIEVPYPSFGDILFFGSVIFYILGAYQLAKVAGLKFSTKSLKGKVLAFIIPVAILIISYLFFLKGYEPDWSNVIVVFLDFGYPIAQALYVSIAILALLISKDILGGVMRRPVMLLIIALVIQYIADFSFSYQVSRETWYVGGTNDYLFALAYFLMTVSLFSIGNMFYKVQES